MFFPSQTVSDFPDRLTLAKSREPNQTHSTFNSIDRREFKNWRKKKKKKKRMCLFVQNTVYFPLMHFQFHPVSRAMPMRHEARLHWTVFFYVGQTSWRSGGSATSQRRRFADAGFIQAPCRRSEAESQRSQRLEFFVYAFQTHYSWQGFASSSHSFCSQWPPRQTPTNLSASGRHSKLPLKLIRSRGSDAHVVPTHCGETFASVSSWTLSCFVFGFGSYVHMGFLQCWL